MSDCEQILPRVQRVVAHVTSQRADTARVRPLRCAAHLLQQMRAQRLAGATGILVTWVLWIPSLC